jgi:hypothetical protein
VRRYLVVGHQTLASRELRAAVLERLAAEPCRFHVVVPATPPHEHFVWSEGEVIATARGRLEETLAWMHAQGALTTGEVGDAYPLVALTNALSRDDYDEIILSTLPPGLSRWIRQDLVHRVTRHTDTPVCHIVASVPSAKAAR